ncbi:hypothetical protein [Streptomyces sp. NPDC003327]
MNRRRAAAALPGLLAAAGLLPLTACGIQQSDVVEAGGAPTVAVAPIPESRMILYFLGPDGRSMPVAREVGVGVADPTHPGDGTGAARLPYDGFGTGYEIRAEDLRGTRVVTDKVLGALLHGPGDTEAAAGLTTALPASRGLLHVQEEKQGGTEGRRLFRVRAPFPVTGLREPAVQQLVCTTAYAEDPAGRAEVTLTGPDGTLPAERCRATP